MFRNADRVSCELISVMSSKIDFCSSRKRKSLHAKIFENPLIRYRDPPMDSRIVPNRVAICTRYLGQNNGSFKHRFDNSIKMSITTRHKSLWTTWFPYRDDFEFLLLLSGPLSCITSASPWKYFVKSFKLLNEMTSKLHRILHLQWCKHPKKYFLYRCPQCHWKKLLLRWGDFSMNNNKPHYFRWCWPDFA